MNTTQRLQAAKKLISNRKNWCKGFYLFKGKHCAIGALKAVGWSLKADNLLDKAAVRMGYECAIVLNDDGTHKLVMKMFDAAIRASKK